MKPAITDIFFDLDHTLWDFDKNSGLAFETIFAKHDIAVDLDRFLQHYVPVNVRYWEAYRSDRISHGELRLGRLRETFRLADFEVSDALLELLADDYIQHLPLNNHLFEGTIELLDYLSAKYRLHIITNGFAEVQQKKLANSGILRYFSTVTDSEMAGCKKPHPDIFNFAMEVASATAEKSIMIGDCVDADVRGAMACGIDAILFGCHSDSNIKQVKTLSELKNHL